LGISGQLLKEELTIKEERVEKLAIELGLEGICLFKYMNYAWFTGGGTNRVITGSERGCSFVLFLNGKKFVFAPRNEIERITSEQVSGQSFEPITYDWFANPIHTIKEFIGDKKVGSDVPISGLEFISDEIDRLRFSLTTAEISKAKEISEICSREMAALCTDVKPGSSEQQIVARLSSRLLEYGVRPAVLLVGVDERISTCRHPVATDKKLKKYGLVSLVGEKWGLHITLTRAFYLGRIPKELKEKQEYVTQIEAKMIANTVIGNDLETIFDINKKEFARFGYKEEWKMHHQGGPIGYGPREFRVGERNEKIQENQMFGWNPTLQGTKSEGTILVRKHGIPLILDTVPKWWPTNKIEINGTLIERPMILGY